MQIADAFKPACAPPESARIPPAPDSASAITSRAVQPLILRLTIGQVAPAMNRLGWVLFGVMLVIGFGQCFMQVTPQDEGELLVYPWLIAHGSMPYRDIWMMYPPSTYLILAALFKAGIPGLVAERAFSLAIRVLYVLLVNRTLTGRWSRFSWLGVPITSSLLFYEVNADMRAYPWTVGLPLVLLGLVSARKHPYPSAALFYCAGTFRYEFALAGCVALAAQAALHLPDRQRFRRESEAAATLALGTIAFCLTLIVVSGGDALHQTIFEPLLISPGRRLPLLPPHFGWWGLPLELAVLAGPPAMVVAGLVLRRPYLVGTNLAALVLVQHFLQRADWIYLLCVGAIVVPWMLVSLADLLRRPEGVRLSPSILGPERTLHGMGAMVVRGVLGYIAIAIAGWYLLLALVLAVYVSPLSPLASASVLHDPSLLVQSGGNAIIVRDLSEAVDVRAVVHYIQVHRRPDQRVFVAPRALRYAIWNDTALYYVLGLRPASKYLEMNPGVETRVSVQREIIRDLHSCTWIVLSRAGYWYEPNTSHVPGSPLLQRFIRGHYRRVFNDSSYQIFKVQTSLV